ncbi:KPN_02809 family neutral zinc metallopeptidase [Falsiroseomonas oryzae]|uniref:KPN_02809 family neutral zinc metallopeptidase n=1 Tax=Falsiroseomonas oryzae TaxID=2766473 RepID=UPI0022EA241C|nr:neutral zinc metallopeptidase [Roseomonas sp. MO-31]
MRLEDGRESGNVEDRRGRGGGFGGGRMVAGGGIGTIVLVVLALLFGVDPGVILSGGGPAPAPPAVERGEVASRPPAEDAAARFVSRVLAETEDVWNPAFQQLGRRYEEPRLVLYSGVVQSGCGTAQAQVGPFYCPADKRVYLDLDFLAQLQRSLGANGDFAAAYIIAHEVGHHVQNLLGIIPRVEQLKRQANEVQSNALQVRVELQADCLAGLWARRAHEARQILEQGDIEEGLNAAAAVGDDRLQRRARGTVQPETFTHGSSAQRVRWFRRGLESGRLDACDTFGTEQL